MYDDVIAAPPGSEENVNPNRIPPGAPPVAPGPSPNGLAFPPKNPQMMQRFQLYVGNLTWVCRLILLILFKFKIVFVYKYFSYIYLFYF